LRILEPFGKYYFLKVEKSLDERKDRHNDTDIHPEESENNVICAKPSFRNLFIMYLPDCIFLPASGAFLVSINA
jgi:hypothetical protein